MALEPSGEIELKQDDVDLPRLQARGPNQLVDVDGARAERLQNALPVTLTDIGERWRRVRLIARRKLYARRCGAAAKDRRQRLDDVLRGRDQRGALLQEIVGPRGAWIERVPRDGKDFATLLSGQPCGDQRSRPLGRLDDDNAQGNSRDQPITPRKVLCTRREARRTLTDEEPALTDRLLEARILRRVDDVDAAGDDGDRAMLEACGVRGGVDAAREARGDGEAFETKGVAIWRVNFWPTAEPLRAPTMATMGISASSSRPRT